MVLEKSGYELTLDVLGKSDVNALVGVVDQALQEPDEKFRRRTAEFLAKIPDAGVTRLLLRRFHDIGTTAQGALVASPDTLLEAASQLSAVDDTHVRANVVEALAALGDARAVPLMLKYVDDPAAPVRDRARALLHTVSRRQQGAPTAAGTKARTYVRTALNLVLRGREITDEGLTTIVSLGDEGFQLLVPFLSEKGADGADKIIDFLTRAPGIDVVRCLFYLAAVRPEHPRRVARDILKSRPEGAFLLDVARVVAEKGVTALGPLAATLRHLHWQVLTREDLAQLEVEAQRAVLELVRGSIGSTSERVERLVPLLASPSSDIRAETLQSLAELPTKRIFAHVVPLLADPVDVIALKATALIDVHEHFEAFGLLLKQLGHRCEHVREEAAKKLSGRTFFLLSRKWEGLGPEHKRRAARALMRIDPQFRRQLEAEVDSGDGIRVLRALGMIRQVEDLAPFAAMLANLTLFPDPFVRATGARLVGRLSGREAVRTCELLLGDQDPRVLANSIESLSAAGGPSAAPLLRVFLEHWHPRVRATAIVELWRLGFTDVAGSLREMLGHKDKRARASGRWAVEKLRALIGTPASAQADRGTAGEHAEEETHG